MVAETKTRLVFKQRQPRTRSRSCCHISITNVHPDPAHSSLVTRPTGQHCGQANQRLAQDVAHRLLANTQTQTSTVRCGASKERCDSSKHQNLHIPHHFDAHEVEQIPSRVRSSSIKSVYEVSDKSDTERMNGKGLPASMKASLLECDGVTRSDRVLGRWLA